MSSLLQAAISSAKLPWSNCWSFEKDPLKERPVSVSKVKEKRRMYLCTFFPCLVFPSVIRAAVELWIVQCHLCLPACLDQWLHGKNNMNWLRCRLSWLSRSLASLKVRILELWETGQWVESHSVKGKFGKQDTEINGR